jgi:thermitase
VMKTQKTFLTFVIVVLLPMLLFSGTAFAALPEVGSAGAEELLIKFRPDVNPSEMAQIHRQQGGQVKETIPSIGVQVVTIPSGKAAEKIKGYSANPKVLYAEANYLATAIYTPDDAYFDKQWGLNKIQAPQAWDVTKGSSSIEIAILDTGVDLDHPDLTGKIVESINFTSSATADDIYGHGTHVAGIAAASTNNGVGVAGLGYSSSIVNVKVLGDDGKGYYSWIAKGIIWAADNGAEVINLSLGGSSASSTLEDAVNYAWNKGTIVVAAAGNNGSSSPFYPAYYLNTMAVAATDINDSLASWSNRGEWVDVAAPGVGIYSTLKDGGYGNKSGTSMASPYTSGLAALLYSVVTDSNGNGRLNDEVRSRIETTADNIGSVGVGSGRINAFKAVSGSPPFTGSITGRVTDSADGLPIAGATVSDGARSVGTDASGNYAIYDIPPGSYTVTAHEDGYQTSSISVDVVSGQATTADFALKRTELSPQPMWIESINFSTRGKNLGIAVKVVSTPGYLSGANVRLELACSGGQSWSFNGITDSSGMVAFVVQKAPAADYVARVTSLTATDHNWDTSQGVTSASYAISGGGGRPRK